MTKKIHRFNPIVNGKDFGWFLPVLECLGDSECIGRAVFHYQNLDRLALHTTKKLKLRQSEEERGTFFEFRFEPDTAAVTFDDLFAYRQTDPGARVLFARVQPLKDAEDPIRILRRNANAVITDRNEPFIPLVLDANVNPRSPLTAILDGVADQVLKHL